MTPDGYDRRDGSVTAFDEAVIRPGGRPGRRRGGYPTGLVIGGTLNAGLVAC